MHRHARILVAVAVASALPGTPGRAAGPPPTAEAVATWQQRTAAGDWEIWYGVLGRPSAARPATELAWWTPAGGVAAPVALLPGDDENPAVSIRPGGGETIAVWDHTMPSGDRDVWWSRLTEEGWTAPSAIASLDGDDVDPAVAVGDDGRALAVWVHDDGVARRPASSVFDGSRWSEPALLDGTDASLPEVAFLDPATEGARALAVYADIAGGSIRTHFTVWDGAAWSPGAPVPLAADQTAQMPEHASGDYSKPQGAFARLGLAPEADGGAVVLWSGPVGEPLQDRYASRSVMGARMGSSGAWTALRLPGGSAKLAGGCYTPALAATAGRDVVAAFGGTPSLVEYMRSVDAEVTAESRLYDTGRDDVRPAVAPLADRVLVVGSGLSFPWDPAPGLITWSLGTLRPAAGTATASITWDKPAALPLPGDARYPSVASSLGGTTAPLRAGFGGRAAGVTAVTIAGEHATADTGSVWWNEDGETTAAAATSGPTPVGVASGVATRLWRDGEDSGASVSIASLALATTPPVTIHGLRVTARAGCAAGTRSSLEIASVRVGDGPPVAVDGRKNSSIALVGGTLRINEETRSPTSVTVRAVRYVSAHTDTTVGLATATLAGCVGSGLPVFGDGVHEH